MVVVGFASQGLPAAAQGFDTPLLDQAASMSPGQDSLLPPEVVPMQVDSSSAASGSSVSGMTMGATQGSLTDPMANVGGMNTGMQNARQMRQQMFQSLFQPGQTALPPKGQPFDPNLSGQAGIQDPNGGFTNPSDPNFAPTPLSQQGNGQPSWLASNTSQMASTAPGQSQTLTGGSKQPIVRRDTRRGGAANNISGAMGLGGGMLFTQVRRPNSLFGLGFSALTLSGFGLRNGFRF
jgi:hypothetical protein